jgi:hypothetical protein
MIDERSDTVSEADALSEWTAHGSGWLTALICGTLTGLSLGLLLAPARGAETRRRMRSAAQRRYGQIRRRRRHTEGSPSIVEFADHARRQDIGATAESSR